MKKRFTIFNNVILNLFVTSLLLSQSTNFNLDNYKSFLSTNKNLSSQELIKLYSAGEFLNKAESFNDNALFMDSVKIKYKLTEGELNLLKQNGFVVTERISDNDFRKIFLDVWKKDLPVYISSDAILHAFHRSYDNILKSVETNYLIPRIKLLLSTMHGKLQELESKYSSDQLLFTSLKDVDIYLTVPQKLLGVSVSPYFSENQNVVDNLLEYVEAQGIVTEPLFSSSKRKVDYSQFKPRGHYTETTELSNYFKAMMWFGRIEFYLIKPEEQSQTMPGPTMQDIQRQIIDSYFISELMDASGAKQIYNEIEKVISSFVGEQDNVTLNQAEIVFEAVKINSAKQFEDTVKVIEFQDTLISKPFSEQKILSQLLESDPNNPDKIKPASAFLLFGQRFVIDSYVTGNVVFDRIIYNGAKVKRMLPVTMDILFALGNSASAQLLEPELNNYHYSSNLAALRFLIDSYGSDFWQSSVYNLWLNSIKSLNPPDDRTSLPSFMQTAAWWQHKMNGQLASWAELRHDNILYAKQSYSGMIGCSYPYGFVEPVPVFFESMSWLADKTKEKFSGLSINLSREIGFMAYFKNIMDTLKSISNKELSNIEFSDNEKSFLQKVLFEDPMCGPGISGWYQKLWFEDGGFGAMPYHVDYLVADYHTSPTNEMGGMVGWVKHAGTGPINLMIIVAELPGKGSVAFAGPVSSFYEFTSENFLRLTDDEWKDTYLSKSTRPDWVNIYLADSKGEIRQGGSSLITDIKDERNEQKIPQDFIIAQNYPNPFNAETMISFTIPAKLKNNFAEINIYDIQGRLIKKIFSGDIQPGNYLVRWDGKNSTSQNVSSGIYFYEIKAGDLRAAGKMNLLK